ncbi:MAG TPA: IS200/IS605 family transposase [Fimbriiglobus sp.]|nr:IS200/IS605 family transposase [Fimbriiglobus sp.]
MPQSFAAVHLHIIFSTKNREPLIGADLAPRLYEYLAGTARGNKCRLTEAGGVADHVHLLVSLGREITIADLVRELKAGSSRWIHDTFPDLRGFAWQSGYGAFSVSVGRLGGVKAYIANQADHHRAKTFQEEYREFLSKHGIEWDERYVWD